MPEKPSCLLPYDVKFIHYDLELEPDFVNFTFRGVVKITCEFDHPTDRITLHNAGLYITHASLSYENQHGNDCQATSVGLLHHPAEETVTLVFGAIAQTKHALLTIAYDGILNDSMRGFYRSSYVAADGTTKYLAVTQCEATDARRVLPCGDEPALKATFAVTLIVPETMRALSNMPVHVAVPHDEGKRKLHFGVTPKMSTYLLAIVVGELDFIETEMKSGTRVRAYTTPGKSEQGHFALETACRALEFYNEYFGIAYPLPKLDMVAIPDFAAGAMENWGLVTYRENAVLIDPVHSSAAAYKRVAEVVCHELAHMWFGNLVTMTWWTHLWLNEGFATWVASHAMHHLFPDWNVWNHFVADEYEAGLQLDALRSTHPIEVAVSHPDEISQIFDDIAYAKGASVIRMIHEELGAEAFREGLHRYLHRFAYGNASTDDLWAALSQASGQDVAALMSSWTKQPGFPIVHAITDIDDDHTTLLIEQERFIADGSSLHDAERKQRWNLPRQLHYSLEGSSTKINLGQSSFVRVHYSRDELRSLGYCVESGYLTALDRYGIISDAHALTRAGKVDVVELLTLITMYRRETDYTVWTAVTAALTDLRSLIEDDAMLVRRFKEFECRMLIRIHGILGVFESPDDSHDTKLLRGLIMGAIGSAGNRTTIHQARALFMDHFSGTEILNPNLRAATYKLIAREANWDYYTKLIALLEQATLQEERVRILHAMGLVEESAIIQDLLALIFERKLIRTSDIVYVMPAMGSHPGGRLALWDYVRTNWGVINESYGKGTRMISRILEGMISGHATTNAADMFEVFFHQNPVPSATSKIAQSIETIRTRAAWRQRDSVKIAEFLSEF
ncbi:MAG: M1 family metallopeptidase [Candidatus Pacebacteria bacterium]|nr:M1 family metallopeptidase [Candidatus Paceibacterota bacterium]